MNQGFSYSLAFATGIMGAFHCLGMCGGLAGGYFAGHGWRRKLLPHLLYHGSRIGIYVLLGVTGALLGRVVAQTGIVGKSQGLLMILAGALIMLIGLGLTGIIPWWRRDCSDSGCRVVRFEEHPRSARLLPGLAGLFNGLVPCSLVFSVSLKAAATADPLQSALLMLFFGLGTLPTMGLVTTLGAAVGSWRKAPFDRLTGLLVFLLGGWTLYEGLVFYDIMRGLAN